MVGVTTVLAIPEVKPLLVPSEFAIIVAVFAVPPLAKFAAAPSAAASAALCILVRM